MDFWSTGRPVQLCWKATIVEPMFVEPWPIEMDECRPTENGLCLTSEFLKWWVSRKPEMKLLSTSSMRRRTKAIFEKAVNVSSFHKGGGHAFSLSFIKVRFVEAESPKISTIKITSNAKLISEYLGKESARVKATSFGRMAFIVAAASGRVLAEAMKNEAEDFEVFKKHQVAD